MARCARLVTTAAALLLLLPLSARSEQPWSYGHHQEAWELVVATRDLPVAGWGAQITKRRLLELARQSYNFKSRVRTTRALVRMERRTPRRESFQPVLAGVDAVEVAVYRDYCAVVPAIDRQLEKIPVEWRSRRLVRARERVDREFHVPDRTTLRQRVRRTHRTARAIERFETEIERQQESAPPPPEPPADDGCSRTPFGSDDGVTDHDGHPWVLDTPTFSIEWLTPGDGEAERLLLSIEECHGILREILIIDRGAGVVPRRVASIEKFGIAHTEFHRVERFELNDVTGAFLVDWSFDIGVPGPAPGVIVTLTDYRRGLVAR